MEFLQRVLYVEPREQVRVHINTIFKCIISRIETSSNMQQKELLVYRNIELI